jgi:rhodanese-related sulfurtransferase
MTQNPAALFCLCSLAVGFWSGTLHAESASEALTAYNTSLKQKFPGVATMTPAQLASLDTLPVLLDVRGEKEFAVSHLAGAFRAAKDPIAQLDHLGVKRNDPIVVYCSVGYRSSVLAEKLTQAGFTNVRNLEGSIFAWTNEGRPLVNASGPAEGAHPFNLVWGRFLERSHWRWSPES